MSVHVSTIHTRCDYNIGGLDGTSMASREMKTINAASVTRVRVQVRIVEHIFMSSSVW